MRRLLALALLALGTALLAGCGGGDTPVAGGQPISFRELSEAARTSADATSGRFAFTMDMTYPGAAEPLSFSGGGAFDTPTERASFTVDMSSLVEFLAGFLPDAERAPGAPDFGDPSQWQIEVVQDGLALYMRLPAVAEQLPAGKSWVRMDLAQAAQARGFDFTQLQRFAKNDPRAVLDYLRAASSRIERVGTEELRGVEATRYHATVDLLRYEKLVPAAQREQAGTLLGDVVEQSGIRKIPVNVWVDGFGLVRKLTMSFSATQPGTTTEFANASMSFELYDYGKDVAVALPPASDVVDVSALG
jgi:hypothetical protein